jgi:putative resolvase
LVVKSVQDRGCGLRENRPGLNRVLAMAGDGTVTVVRVRHEDRLARFGAGWVRRLFAVYGVTPGVLHPGEARRPMNSPETSFPWSPPSRAGCAA